MIQTPRMASNSNLRGEPSSGDRRRDSRRDSRREDPSGIQNTTYGHRRTATETTSSDGAPITFGPDPVSDVFSPVVASQYADE